MPWTGSSDPYERQQAAAVEQWKSRPPSIYSNAVGYTLKPLAWAMGQVVPPSVVEGGRVNLPATQRDPTEAPAIVLGFSFLRRGGTLFLFLSQLERCS
jgi:hypothetical protein